MKTLLKFGLLLCVAMAAAAVLLGLPLWRLGIDPGTALHKLSASPGLYLLLAILLLDCFCFTNDLLAYLSLQRPNRFGMEFSEIAFRNEYDDTPIPLRQKLTLVYPLTTAIVLLGLVVALAR